MLNDERIVDALVNAAKYDLKRGINKNELLKSLASVINNDLFNKVKDRL